ncbi:hypothetical protein DSECCO2_664170 [anaerobic digester metagenome]
MLILNIFMKYFLTLIPIVICVLFVWIMSKLMKNQNDFFNRVDNDFPEIKNRSLFSYRQYSKTDSEFGNLYKKHKNIRNKILFKWFLILIVTMVVIIIAGIISSYYNS